MQPFLYPGLEPIVNRMKTVNTMSVEVSFKLTTWFKKKKKILGLLQSDIW